MRARLYRILVESIPGISTFAATAENADAQLLVDPKCDTLDPRGCFCPKQL